MRWEGIGLNDSRPPTGMGPGSLIDSQLPFEDTPYRIGSQLGRSIGPGREPGGLESDPLALGLTKDVC